MRGIRARAILVLSAVAAFGAYAALRNDAPTANADVPAATSAKVAEVAVVATPNGPDARVSEVRVVRIEAGKTSTRVLGRISHGPSAVLRGDVLADHSVVVAADEEGVPSDDYRTALYRLDGVTTRTLARGLYRASRPLVSVDGTIYVERGAPGRFPDEAQTRAGRLRSDSLAIDAVEPSSGAARTVYRSSGYTLHLAGEHGGALIVYRVAWGAAELLTVDRATGQSRIVAAIPPFARDFSVDGKGQLVFANRDEQDHSLWCVERVDLATGLRTRLATLRDEAPIPFLLDDGSVAWTSPSRPPALHAAGASLAKTPLFAALGNGTRFVSRSAESGWIALEERPHGVLAATRAVHLASGTAVPLAADGEHVEVLGFVGANGRGAR